MKKEKRNKGEIEVYEEWKKGWRTPDIYVKKDRRKRLTSENIYYLKYHTEGKLPFIKIKL